MVAGGIGAYYCKPSQWRDNGDEVVVLVSCYNASGTPVDSTFSATFMSAYHEADAIASNFNPIFGGPDDLAAFPPRTAQVRSPAPHCWQWRVTPGSNASFHDNWCFISLGVTEDINADSSPADRHESGLVRGVDVRLLGTGVEAPFACSPWLDGWECLAPLPPQFSTQPAANLGPLSVRYMIDVLSSSDDLVRYRGSVPIAAARLELRDPPPPTPPTPPALPEPEEGALILRPNLPFEGPIPYVGSFGSPGNGGGTAISLRNPSYSIHVQLLTAGHDSDDCGDPSAVVQLPPGATTTPEQMEQIYETSSPALPISVVACVFHSTGVPPQWVELGVTYQPE